MCTPMKEKTGLFHGAIVALSFAHDIRGSDAWQLGYLLVGGTSAARPCGHAASGDQSETDSQCLGDSR